METGARGMRRDLWGEPDVRESGLKFVELGPSCWKSAGVGGNRPEWLETRRSFRKLA